MNTDNINYDKSQLHPDNFRVLEINMFGDVKDITNTGVEKYKRAFVEIKTKDMDIDNIVCNIHVQITNMVYKAHFRRGEEIVKAVIGIKNKSYILTNYKIIIVDDTYLKSEAYYLEEVYNFKFISNTEFKVNYMEISEQYQADILIEIRELEQCIDKSCNKELLRQKKEEWARSRVQEIKFRDIFNSRYDNIIVRLTGYEQGIRVRGLQSREIFNNIKKFIQNNNIHSHTTTTNHNMRERKAENCYDLITYHINRQPADLIIDNNEDGLFMLIHINHFKICTHLHPNERVEHVEFMGFIWIITNIRIILIEQGDSISMYYENLYRVFLDINKDYYYSLIIKTKDSKELREPTFISDMTMIGYNNNILPYIRKFNMRVNRAIYGILKSNGYSEQAVKASAFNIEFTDGFEFERYIADLIIYNGYNNVEVTKASHDYGVDVIWYARGMKLGIQCKKYNTEVGVQAIHEVIYGCKHYGCNVSIVASGGDSGFSNEAIELANQNNVLLWDKNFLLALAPDGNIFI